MHDSEWARYLAEIIYILWFQIFCTTLPMYPNHARELVTFAKKMIAYLARKLHPMRDVEIIYRRLFEACGTCRLQDEILDLFQDMKRNKIDPDKVTFGTYYQAFQVSKKQPPTAVTQNMGGGGGPFVPTQEGGGARDKESYLKYTPDDYQMKLQQFAFSQQKEEEKVNYNKAPLIDGANRFSSGSFNSGSNVNDYVDTQVESSSRLSCVKLSQVLQQSSLYFEFD